MIHLETGFSLVLGLAAMELGDRVLKVLQLVADGVALVLGVHKHNHQLVSHSVQLNLQPPSLLIVLQKPRRMIRIVYKGR